MSYSHKTLLVSSSEALVTMTERVERMTSDRTNLCDNFAQERERTLELVLKRSSEITVRRHRPTEGEKEGRTLFLFFFSFLFFFLLFFVFCFFFAAVVSGRPKVLYIHPSDAVAEVRDVSVMNGRIGRMILQC